MINCTKICFIDLSENKNGQKPEIIKSPTFYLNDKVTAGKSEAEGFNKTAE